MKFYEIKIDLALYIPFYFQKSLEPLSKLLATALMRSPLQKLHLQKGGFKHYVLSNLIETSQDKIYPKGNNFFLFSYSQERASDCYIKCFDWIFGLHIDDKKEEKISYKKF